MHSLDSSEMIPKARTLVDLLCWRASHQPEQVAYTFLLDGESQHVSLTYRELDQQARLIGARLQGQIAAGERVVLLYPPGLDYIAAFWGCLYAGVVVVPAYPPKRNRTLLRLKAIMADAQAVTALTTAAIMSRIQPIVSDLSDFGTVRWLVHEELVEDAKVEWQPRVIAGDTLAFLQYTSGSTSAPKGVMLTHRNLLSNEEAICKAFRQTEQSVIVGWLPLYHDMGLIGNVIQPLFTGARCILMSPISFLQRPSRWLRAISRYKATTSGGPNFAYDLCARKIKAEECEGLDLSSWSIAFNGAEPIRSETLEKFAATFEPYGFRREAFYPCYGLAESTLLVASRFDERPTVVKSFQARALEAGQAREVGETNDSVRFIVGCGRSMPEHEIVVADPESLRQCASDEIGEIWISGPSVSGGYWNQPEETERVFRAYLSDTAAGPFLRTGDLGFLQDGELFITGRLKDLLIIRGLNHYPQDIELTVEKSHVGLRPGCGAAVSVEHGGEERLVIVQEVDHHQSELEEIIQRINEAVSENHEVQTYAVALIKPGTIPKTSSGKIQRHACRDAFLKRELPLLAEWHANSAIETEMPALASTPFELDAGVITDWLRQLLASKLAMEPQQIDIDHSIVRYGLDSLIAVELMHDIEARLGVVLPLSEFLQSRSISQLAKTILVQSNTDAPAPETAVIHTTNHNQHPLSRGQQALWFLYQIAPSSAAYNIAGAVRIRTPLDVAALRRVFQRLVDRHPALRIAFSSIDGRPVQRVREHAEAYIQVTDASEWSEDALKERLVEESHRPFDLEHGPLLRVSLFRLSEQEHVLLLVLHHIVSDFWSVALLIHEIRTLYASELVNESAELPPLKLQYSDYVRWQEAMLQSEKGEGHWVYWQKQLGGELPSLNLPFDHHRGPLQSYRGSSESFKLDVELTRRLRSLGQENEATLYMTLLAAFQVLLHRYTNQAEIIVGATTLGRARKEFAGLVGYFVNLLPLRLKLPDCQTFISFLRQAREVVLEAFEHQDFPFATIVERLQPQRDPNRSPLFQVAFVFQKAQFPEEKMLAAFATGVDGVRMSLGDLELESIALEQRIAQFDLTLMVAENDGELTASLEYNSDLFEAATVGRMVQNFQVLLRSIPDNVTQNVFALPLLTPAERQQVLSGWNDTKVEYPSEQCIHDLFEDQVRRTPEALAIVCDRERINYAELSERANQLAHYLRAHGVRPEMKVAVLMERSVELVVGLLGILKAGGAYLPLDPAYPSERLAFMLEDANVFALLTQANLIDKLPAHNGPTLCLDSDWDLIKKEPTSNLASGASPENLAYVIYTSGSTGKPKGTMVRHRGLVNYLSWCTEAYAVADGCGAPVHSSISFDLTVTSLFAPLIVGKSVFLVPDGIEALAKVLLERHDYSPVKITPAHLRVLEELMPQCEISQRIQALIIGGEALHSEDLRFWRQHAPATRLINEYGPTETVVGSCVYEVGAEDASSGPVPIGRPVANTQVYILNDALQLVPVGVSGELYIGGDGLARGYLNQPELTAERFVPHPFSTVPGARLYRTGDLVRYLPNGELDYLGRLDYQVKIRGFRVELSEIEAVLMQHEALREAIVMVRVHERATDRHEVDSHTVGVDNNKHLVAYVVAKNKTAPSSTELRQFLQTKLPSFMLPAAFVMLDEMPLTSTGKVNRRALPALESNRPDLNGNYVAPRTSVEEKLAEIWRAVLGIERAGVHDNFYELGGDSIISLQVVARANQAGLPLSAQDLLQHQTISDLAAVAAANGDNQLVEQDTVTGPVSLTPIQHWFFEKRGIDLHHYNQSLTLRVRQPVDVNLLQQALEHLIAHHDALRLRFEHDGTGWRQINAEREPNQFLSRIDVSLLDGAAQEASFKRAAAAAHRSLSLSEGPLIRALFFDAGAAATGRLLLIIHHLAVDGVSWRILLEDLDLAYQHLSRGEAVTLERKTSSFKQWADQLQQYGKSQRCEQELSYWLTNRRPGVPRLPVDTPGGINDVASCGVVSVELDREETQALRQQVPRAYHTQINEVLLTALLQAHEQWCGEHRLLIDLEGHGREEGLVGLNLSRTVGWFTSIFPLLLELSSATTPGETLQQVKEQLRRVPQKGVGYGVLRYGCGPEISASLQARPESEMSFNYLGQLDGSLSTSEWFGVVHEMNGTSRSPNGTRRYLIEIDGWTSGDQLRLNFSYSKNLHRRATIQRLAESFITSLRELITHCQTLKEGSFTPSDFPLAKLDQRKFSKVAALLNKEI